MAVGRFVEVLSFLIMEIPKNIQYEYSRLVNLYNWSWIGYNANKEEYFVSIIPFGWLKPSLFITKIQ